jgi:hypothetical protein
MWKPAERFAPDNRYCAILRAIKRELGMDSPVLQRVHDAVAREHSPQRCRVCFSLPRVVVSEDPDCTGGNGLPAIVVRSVCPVCEAV